MKNNKMLKNVIKLCISLFLFFYRSILITPIVYIFNINTKKMSTLTEIILSLTANIILCIVIILMYRKELIKEWKKFKENLFNNIDTSIKYWLIGLIIMVMSNFIIAFILGGGQATNEQGVQKMIESSPIIMLITAGIIGPINEELIFRKCFKNILKNKWFFILISGIVFGYLHVSGANSLNQFLYIIPYSSLGIAFATTYYKTNTVFSSIFVHMLHNTILTLISISI